MLTAHSAQAVRPQVANNHDSRGLHWRSSIDSRGLHWRSSIDSRGLHWRSIDRRGLHYTRGGIRSCSSVQTGSSSNNSNEKKRPVLVLRMVSAEESASELAQASVNANVIRPIPEMHSEEHLSNEEMMERIEFLKRLPHKLLRDIGYTIAGPSLLSTSKELPIVNPSMLGGSSDQWPSTKAWLQHLPIPALEEWFASHPRSQRLGDHFARCIEYVLRHSPNVQVQHLHTSTQVLERVTEPLRKSKALMALLARTSTSTSTEPPNNEEVEALDVAAATVGKRKRKLLKKLERIQLLKGRTNTVGEFDYLFETTHAGELHHWEVSVKFLLYAGPWEAFGLQSPPNQSDNSIVEGGDAFLGCYLGPHVGETLFDRKARLCNQLALSHHPCAAILLHNLYVVDKGGSNELSVSSTTNALEAEDGEDVDKGCNEHFVSTTTTIEVEDGDGEEETQGVLVVPSALLKGYLFYEYKLWRFLGSSSASSMGAITECELGGGGERASLSKVHSMGWWTRDIREFGELPEHINSNWYIVPKLEWLSPVVIPSWEPDRCARVLELHDFVRKAQQVEHEAARLQMPRKRRFLVAELRWNPNWKPTSMHCCGGAWVESSRGFVVETSWPDSKMYKPHGYVVSWSPSLQELP